MRGLRFCRDVLLFSLLFMYASEAQEVAITTPIKITPGLSKVEILGKTSQGILAHHTFKSEEEILAYYDNMQLHWKKPVPKRDKKNKTEEILIRNDSVLFIYSESIKGATILKFFKTGARVDAQTSHVVLDTLSKNAISAAPRPHFVTTPDKQFILCWFQDVNFENNHRVHFTVLNDLTKKIWQTDFTIPEFENPEILGVALDSTGNATMVTGDYREKNFTNDFHYTAFCIITLKDRGKVKHQTFIREADTYFSECIAQQDVSNGSLVMSGLYSHNIGNESDGTFFIRFNTALDSVVANGYETHSQDLLTQLTGNNPPKKNDGFYDFHPVDLIVKRDGGAIVIAEAQSMTSEAYNNPPFGGFGITNGFTVNYFHYDDLIVVSFKPDGSVEWKQVLHKKQSTEGDGGFFSSIASMIAPTQLYFIFNDAVNGQTILTDFSIDASGVQKRNEIFSAERKGVNVVPRQAKQISANEIMFPSFKKNYLQFVKITF